MLLMDLRYVDELRFIPQLLTVFYSMYLGLTTRLVFHYHSSDDFDEYHSQYITWIASGTPSWTLNVAGMAADNTVEIAARPIPQEPMVCPQTSLTGGLLNYRPISQYLIINLGMSTSFAIVDFEHLTFPNHLRVDYVRVYQDPNNINIGCDPEDFPTADYINT